jgi:hypothetical protein
MLVIDFVVEIGRDRMTQAEGGQGQVAAVVVVE